MLKPKLQSINLQALSPSLCSSLIDCRSSFFFRAASCKVNSLELAAGSVEVMHGKPKLKAPNSGKKPGNPAQPLLKQDFLLFSLSCWVNVASVELFKAHQHFLLALPALFMCLYCSSCCNPEWDDAVCNNAIKPEPELLRRK